MERQRDTGLQLEIGNWPQRDAALVGVGANITVRDRMTLFFDYDVQAGQQSYLEQSVKGGIKLSF